ncbi:hypothetical protein CMI41_03295 [Candidatus Pacearchaeota archaeon]|nr:hypothetical protein [Candidatus Pacearchaeota archaeon]|tara:strand:- start:1337 stop:2011 length:675 start_codon:yes stop_codon:yes gene_type:complete
MEKLVFTSKKPIVFIGRKKVFNFLNMESLWQFKNNKAYAGWVLKKDNVNFPDGRMIGKKLGIEQVRGPFFTKCFLKQGKAIGKKHFFIGGVVVKQIIEHSGLKKNEIRVYNPPYVKGSEFGENEIIKIVGMLKDFEANFVWVGVGSPKQEILGNQLHRRYKADYFNVGAGLDFLVGNNKEAPGIWGDMGLEWFYQLLVHPRRAWKKVRRHFIALRWIGDLRVGK